MKITELYEDTTGNLTASVTGIVFLEPLDVIDSFSSLTFSDYVEPEKTIEIRKGKDRNNFRKKWKNKFYH